jgi:hypothetical protein
MYFIAFFHFSFKMKKRGMGGGVGVGGWCWQWRGVRARDDTKCSWSFDIFCYRKICTYEKRNSTLTLKMNQICLYWIKGKKKTKKKTKCSWKF